MSQKVSKIQLLPAKGQKVHYAQKSPKEKLALAVQKKNHHKLFNELFGTKRPTAGVVSRHFSSQN